MPAKPNPQPLLNEGQQHQANRAEPKIQTDLPVSATAPAAHDLVSFTIRPVPGRYQVWQAVRTGPGQLDLQVGPAEPSSYAAQRAANWLQGWANDQLGRPAADWPKAPEASESREEAEP